MKIAVIGTGYWGKNLVRNFHEIGVLNAICDSNSKNLQEIQTQYQVPQTFRTYHEVLENPDIQAIAIATPAETHYEIAKNAIAAGKDIFIEKPLALNIRDAEEIVAKVEASQTVFMVDHVLQYHPAVIKLKQLIDEGILGKLQYLYSNRLNIGKLRTEENILWSFAPHDISVILALVEKQPQHVQVFGEAYLQDHIYDTTITDLTFVDRLKAHIYVSWLHPYKEQKLVVIGNSGMAVFNDMEKAEKLTLYHHKIEWINRTPVATKAQKEVIPVEPNEPLREACLHFLDCVKTRKRPRTDAQEALSVLRVLQKAQEYLDKGKGYE
jgi:UDP-2-acetamido-3-amino-2,3-dideoxy-glucuronate N-acetyltransferase